MWFTLPALESRVLESRIQYPSSSCICKLRRYSPIGLSLPVVVDHDVNVPSATRIVAWVDSRDLDDTLWVGEVATAQERIGLDVSGLASRVASVETGSVRCPELNECVGHGLAGAAVDQANVEDEGDAAIKIKRISVYTSAG